jgi:hypothetical protein
MTDDPMNQLQPEPARTNGAEAGARPADPPERPVEPPARRPSVLQLALSIMFAAVYLALLIDMLAHASGPDDVWSREELLLVSLEGFLTPIIALIFGAAYGREMASHSAREAEAATRVTAWAVQRAEKADADRSRYLSSLKNAQSLVSSYRRTTQDHGASRQGRVRLGVATGGDEEQERGGDRQSADAAQASQEQLIDMLSDLLGEATAGL